MSAPGENSELYHDSQSSVTPIWLINGKSRYALRTLVRLEFHKISQPRLRAGFMLLLGIVLTLVSVRYILLDAQPYIIPNIMLVGSLMLLAGGVCVLYLARPRYCIDVTLMDGSCVSLRRRRKADAERLLASLNVAMDWHSANSDPEYGELQRTSRVSQGIARSRGRLGKSPPAASSTPVARRPVSPVVATERAGMKAQIAPLLSLFSAKRRRRPVD